MRFTSIKNRGHLDNFTLFTPISRKVCRGQSPKVNIVATDPHGSCSVANIDPLHVQSCGSAHSKWSHSKQSNSKHVQLLQSSVPPPRSAYYGSTYYGPNYQAYPYQGVPTRPSTKLRSARSHRRRTRTRSLRRRRHRARASRRHRLGEAWPHHQHPYRCWSRRCHWYRAMPRRSRVAGRARSVARTRFAPSASPPRP